MNASSKARTTIIAAAIIAISAYAGAAAAKDIHVKLSGDQEVPAVTTSAKGEGTITVGDDKSVKGSVKTSGVDGTMAHIHNAAPGKNGPVAVPLQKGKDGSWEVPPGAKLTDAQYKEFEAGNLYVNVHSAANAGGEIRGQLK